MPPNKHACRGCQLKEEPMQAWGLPSRSTAATLRPATYFSGYIKRATLGTLG